MPEKKEDNTVFVLHKAIKYLKIKVTKTTVTNFLINHPYYPSLKSVSDALDDWKIKHYALNLNLNEIKDLQVPFIAHLEISGGRFAFVEKIENDHVTYFVHDEQPKIDNFNNFSEILSGAVLIMEAKEISGEKDYKKVFQDQILKKSLLPFGISTLLIFALQNYISGSQKYFFQFDFLFILLLCTKILGITVSIFLVTHELKLNSDIRDKICSFSSKTNCNAILDSNASRIFGWCGWADVGLIYFIGTILFLLGINSKSSLSVLSFFSLFTIPYPVYSIYYQARKIKKWCPLCLSVQIILIIESVFLLHFLDYELLSKIDFLKFLFTIAISSTFWLYFKAYFIAIKEKNTFYHPLQKFKRNPKVFMHLLKNSIFFKIFEKKEDLIFGDSNSPIKITAFFSLHCNHCATAFNQIEILLNSSKDFNVNLIFLDYQNIQAQKIISTLHYYYKNKGSKVVFNFLNEWFSLSKSKRNQYFKSVFPEDVQINSILLEENQRISNKLNVYGTPTVFIYGYKFPSQFELSDLKYFINELKILNKES